MRSTLAAQALLVHSEMPQLGLLLSIEAVEAIPVGLPVPPAIRDALNQLLENTGGVPLNQHIASVTALAFSPDGQWLASGSQDGTATVWDPSKHEPIRNLSGHTDGIIDVAVSPDGRLFATASLDGTARLWDVVTGQEVIKLVGYVNGVMV